MRVGVPLGLGELSVRGGMRRDDSLGMSGREWHRTLERDDDCDAANDVCNIWHRRYTRPRLHLLRCKCFQRYPVHQDIHCKRFFHSLQAIFHAVFLFFSEALVHDVTIPVGGSFDHDLALLQGVLETNVPAYILAKHGPSDWLAISYVPDSAKVRDKVSRHSTHASSHFSSTS